MGDNSAARDCNTRRMLACASADPLARRAPRQMRRDGGGVLATGGAVHEGWQQR